MIALGFRLNANSDHVTVFGPKLGAYSKYVVVTDLKPGTNSIT